MDEVIDLTKYCPPGTPKFYIFPIDKEGNNYVSYCGVGLYIKDSNQLVYNNGWNDNVDKQTIENLGELVCKRCKKAHYKKLGGERCDSSSV